MRFRNEHVKVNGEYTPIFTGLKMLSTGNSTVSFTTAQTDIQYSNDGETWNNYTSDTSISLANGQSVYWKRISAPEKITGSIGQFNMTGSIAASGNIHSLLDGTSYSFTDLTGWGGTDGIFAKLFYRCTSLTSAPVLPATTLTKSCYSYMFMGCTGLIAAPVLPATTLAQSCYSYMFQECTGLIAAPVLQATTLAQTCYYSMFKGCTSLNYIKCLAADISAYHCTYNWTNGVSSTGTFVKNTDMPEWTTGADGIPSGWTVVDE